MITEVTLRRNNPYVNGKIVSFTDTEEQLLLRSKMEFTPKIGDTYHMVKEGDRLDLIAYKEYRNRVPDPSKWWWVIADANQIHNPFDLSEWVGRELHIPNIDDVLLRIP